jgi:hypothetical protein
MRVALIASVGERWLAGTPGTSERVHSSAADIRFNGQILTQENNYLRAQTAEVIDRGNLKTTITFTTSRLFATANEAEMYSAFYDAVNPRTGTLILEFVQPLGSVTRGYLRKAVVEPPGRQVIGCTVLLSYTVRGGAITSTP